MRHAILIKSARLFMGFAICIIYYADAAKVWNNNPNITEPSAFAPVVDETLTVQGTNQLAGHIHIAAITTDVDVTLLADSIITTSDLLAPAELHIYANNGQQVIFNVTQDLLFSGSHQDLLITFSGQGNLVFQVEGDKVLTFSALANQGGTKFLVNIDNFAHSPEIQSVIFKRFPLGGGAEQNQNAIVGIGPRSIISFIAPPAGAAAGIIGFDPSNDLAHYGRLLLQIGDGGAYNTQAHLNNAGVGNGFGDITLADIDLTTNVGTDNSAHTSIINSNGPTAWSGLMVVNGNTQWTQLESNPWCEAVVSTTPVGFVLGKTGLLSVADNSYLDYVVTITNYSFSPTVDPDILEARELEGFPQFTYVKDRNPSAFIVDGNNDPFLLPRAQIQLQGKSGIYFRAGVDKDGLSTFTVFDPVLSDTVISFTISPLDTEHGFAGYGEIVFDVEGAVDIIGQQDLGGENVLQILSLQVSPTGGSVFIESPDVTFPRRTYARDADGVYLQYNTACFMVNNRMQLIAASLQHTDTLHFIYDKNLIAQSEASYIGGETWKLCESRPRPNIVLYNSLFLVHTSAALTGVDLFIPENSIGGLNNSSTFKFYYNGRCFDQGTGRQLVLGTEVGSLASDLNTVINRDAHLDIFQEFAKPIPGQEILNLIVSPNNNKVEEGLPANGSELLNQFSIQTIFQGWNSNISIGTNATFGTDPITGSTFVLTTTPELFINGDFFSFQTQGGDTNTPELAMTTGVGGIFVDKNGVIEIESNKRASFGTLVVKSRNGSIDLPKRQVFFDARVGIAHWRINLTDPEQRELVALGQSISDYTLDWANLTKDYCVTPTTSAFIPYEPVNTPAACQAPAIINQNLIGIPVVRGTIDQMQIKNSRLGDQAHMMVDGGIVRELVMLTGNITADAPVGVIILQNDANLGLGTAHRNIDSDEAQVVLGLNGIILVPNGNAQVVLNENVLINNVCPIMTGTAFGENGIKDQLFITSVVPREIRVTNEGVLDLSSFMTTNQELVIGGEVTLVLEPGAQLIMGLGKLRIAENAKIFFQPFIDQDLSVGTDLTSTNNFRVRWTGSGEFIMSENAKMIIPRGAFVGVESAGQVVIENTIGVDQTPQVVVNCSYVTTQTWTLRDSAQIQIGSNTDFGGALQIGNVIDQSENGGQVNLNIELNGIGALIDVNSQGFLGFGVGIVSKPEDVIDTWLVSPTFNVGAINVLITQGTFRGSQIYPTSNKLAGLFAIGNTVGQIGFNFIPAQTDILGGGNVALIRSGPVTPTVATTNGVISAALSVGILASTPVYLDTSKLGTFSSGTPAAFFNFITMNDYGQQSTKYSTIALNTLGSPSAGYVDLGQIVRHYGFRIQALNSTVTPPDRSAEEGFAGIALDTTDRTPTYYEVIV